MEDEAVVKRLAGLNAFGEIGEVLHGVGRFVVKQLDFEAAFSCVEHRVGFSCHKCDSSLSQPMETREDRNNPIHRTWPSGSFDESGAEARPAHA